MTKTKAKMTDGCYIPADIWKCFDRLTQDQQDKLLGSIARYFHTGTEPQFDDEALTWRWEEFIKDMLDRYWGNASKRAEAGRRGMATRWRNTVMPDNDSTVMPDNDNKQTFDMITNNSLICPNGDNPIPIPEPIPEPIPTPNPEPTSLGKTYEGGNDLTSAKSESEIQTAREREIPPEVIKAWEDAAGTVSRVGESMLKCLVRDFDAPALTAAIGKLAQRDTTGWTVARMGGYVRKIAEAQTGKTDRASPETESYDDVLAAWFVEHGKGAVTGSGHPDQANAGQAV